MKKTIKATNKSSKHRAETGSSLVLTLLIMTLLLGFVGLVLSRTAAESKVSYNDAAEARARAVSEAGLEDTTRDFATILENKLTASQSDLNTIKNSPVSGFSKDYNIIKTLSQVGKSKQITIQSGAFQGLYSQRDEWQIDVSAQEISSGAKVQIMRRFYNNRIPLFQFGAFFQDDLELNRPPLFTFSGKVHTNSNIFVSSSPLSKSGGIFFKSKVTAAGEIVNDIWKTSTKFAAGTDDSGDVYFPNASGVNQKLTTGNGSVTCNNGTGGILKENGGRGRAFPYPNCVKNTGWATFSQRFEGNLQANTPELRLPTDRLNVPLIEIMRRGKNVGDMANASGVTTPVTTEDDGIVSKERYANKPGIRISLADSKNKLPGCATAVGDCGVQLNAPFTPNSTLPSSSGYQPLPMTDSATYKTTAVNGNRLGVGTREVWIKVELVKFDFDKALPITNDITQDFLSLGMTEPVNDSNFQLMGSYASGQDSRSIIKIQHFYIDYKPGTGIAIPNPGTSYLTSPTMSSKIYNFVGRYKTTSGNTTTLTQSSPCYNFAAVSSHTVKDCLDNNAYAVPVGSLTSTDESQHYKLACINNGTTCANLLAGNTGLGNKNGQGNNTANVGYVVVPFPIQMYDSREGNRADSGSGISLGSVYRNGVMSLIDIDVANLREFFNGTYDTRFPTTTPYAVSKGNIGLKSANVPDSNGWVVYFSDRRGDFDFDGRYTMEDVNPNSSSLIDQDLNNNGIIDTDYLNEAPSQNSTVESALAAVTDHTYYRRGVRLINARVLPGIYDSVTPANTKGFTFASENGVYVAGNYNVQSVTLSGNTNPAASSKYFPQDTTLHIPSSIVGDSVTVLSNSWNDANSFANAFDTTKRDASDTQVRFAMIAGDSLTARSSSSTSGDFDGLNGGLHNFMRFLESWNGRRLNYAGSLINLYNSFNNNGKWKCCATVYDPPTRDWTFDESFNDPMRLPPGSPFVYYLAFTGYQRVNQ